MRSAFKLWPVMLLVGGGGCVPEETQPVSLGESLKYERTREDIDARVQSDGLYFVTPLHIAGHKGERMEVRVYGDNGKLLGLAHATPPYEATAWEKFQVFVPNENLRDMSPTSGFDVYVVAPTDLNHFVAHDRYGQSNLNASDIIWHWIEYRDGARLASGERGMTVTMSLDVDGRQGQTLDTYAVVRDLNFNELSAEAGGPIRIKGRTITPGYPRTHYDNMVFEIPYSRFGQVPPNFRLRITPSVLIGGELVTGNMHFTTWAGGTADDVREKIGAIARGYDEQAGRLQREIELLQSETAQ